MSGWFSHRFVPFRASGEGWVNAPENVAVAACFAVSGAVACPMPVAPPVCAGVCSCLDMSIRLCGLIPFEAVFRAVKPQGVVNSFFSESLDYFFQVVCHCVAVKCGKAHDARFHVVVL